MPSRMFWMFLAIWTTTVLSQGVTVTVSSALSPYQLVPGIPELVSVSSNNGFNFFVLGIKETSQFLVMQVYTQHTPLTLTATTATPQASATGNSVGMVTMLPTGAGSIHWTLSVANSSVVARDNVSALVLLQEYAENVPVPGGCNQVFDLEIDPNIRLTSTEYHTQVWFQWANVGGRRGDPPRSCEQKSLINRLSYEVYVGYVLENDDGVSALFEVVQSMMTAEQVQSNAQKILSIKNDGTQKSLTTVTSQRAQGAVYAVVVTDSGYGLAASYVSSITYGCNYTAGDCSLEYEAVECVMIAVCAVVGLFLLILGHTYLRTEMAVFGFTATTLVSFTLLSLPGTLSEEVCLAIAGSLGVVGAVLWLLVWWKFSFPSVSVLLPGLCAGYLISSALFFTPFANISWWATNLNYGLVFTVVTLLFAVVLLCSPRTLNIVSCALVGGYCVAVAMAIFLHSSVRLMVTNSIHHASVPGYTTFLVISPYQVNDYILVGLWVVLLALGVWWQFHRSKGQPHFPTQRRPRPPHRHHPHVRDGTLPPPPTYDEHSPLLGNQDPPPSYPESINSSQQRPAEVNYPS